MKININFLNIFQIHKSFTKVNELRDKNSICLILSAGLLSVHGGVIKLFQPDKSAFLRKISKFLDKLDVFLKKEHLSI